MFSELKITLKIRPLSLNSSSAEFGFSKSSKTCALCRLSSTDSNEGTEVKDTDRSTEAEAPAVTVQEEQPQEEQKEEQTEEETPTEETTQEEEKPPTDEETPEEQTEE